MLIYKGSLFVLAPILALYLVYAEALLDLLSKGKYGDAQVIATVLMATLIPASHTFLLSGLANTIQQAQAGAKGHLASLFTLPLAIVFLLLGSGPLGIVFALVCNALLYNVIVVHTLRRVGFDYRLDLVGIGKIGLAAGATAGCLYPFVVQNSSIYVATAVGLATLVLFLLFTLVFRPFTEYEQSMMNHLMKRKIFVW